MTMRIPQDLPTSHDPDLSNREQCNDRVEPNDYGIASVPTSRDDDAIDKQIERCSCFNKSENLLTYLLLGVMPFCYGATTRLPFIYFVIHLSVHFELSWWTIGLCVGAYQGCRVLINIGQIFAPKSSHFLGQAVGFVGYLTVFVCDKDRAAPFIVGTAVIGFSETMACMQCYAKDMYKHDPDRKKTQRMMKYQYASVMTGVMFAFCAGGVIYQFYSIRGVAMMGMLVTGTGWSALVCYLEIMRRETAAADTSLVGNTPVGEPAKPSDESCVVVGGFETKSSYEKTDRTCEDDDSSRYCDGQGTEKSVIIEFHSQDSDEEDHQEPASVEDIETGGFLSKEKESCHPVFDGDTHKGSQALIPDPGTKEAPEPSPQDEESNQLQPKTILEVLEEDGGGADGTSVEPPLPSSSIPPTAEDSSAEREDKTEDDEEAPMAAEGGVQEHCIRDAFPIGSDSDNELHINEESKSVSSDAPSDITEDEEDIPTEGKNQEDCIEEQFLSGNAPSTLEESSNSPTQESQSNGDKSPLGIETDIDHGKERDADKMSSYGGAKAAEKTDRRAMMMSMVSHANSNYHSAELPATWLNYLVCASFGIEALTIGYNLSIGPIFILNEFDVKTGITGVLFAVGAGIGAIVAIVVTCTKWGNITMRKIAKSPYDLCIAMGGIALGVFIAAIPIFPIHVVGLILLMAFNDIGCTLLTEFQGSITTASTFSTLGPLGQVARRSLNVVTAVSGPILYGIFRPLPYLVAGTVTSLWVIMLVVAFKFRSKRTAANLAKEFGRSQGSVRSLMSFQTREVIRSCNESKMFTIAEASSNSISEDFDV